MIGQTIAHYRVGEKLGAGGMGEVYRATDTKLNREVALKVLPEQFAKDTERMARFKREAQVLASLNHPNIAAIHGLAEEPGVLALVLELVEGPTLAERIKQGALSLDEALSVAKQIAEALEAAHEKGVIHRDLKPANVKVREDGQVKVLDFGLAKALEDPVSETDLGNSPTLSIAATRAGVILGTAAYMSPEQAAGKKADKRSDIWSFGVVLFEMLTGRRLFTGESISHILADVLKGEPDFEALPEATPESIRKLLRRCLTRDRKRRLRDIGEAWLTLEDALAGTATTASAPVIIQAPAQPLWQRWMPWAVAGVLALVTVVLAILVAGYASQEVRVVRASLPAPEGTAYHLASTRPGPAKLSPDGKMIAFAALDEDGAVLLYVRSLDAAEAHALSGTEGAGYPFWSPDSAIIGFFAGGKLKKISAGGGPPLTLCDASNGKSGTWNRDGVILFAPSHDAVIHRVPEAGGEPAPITEFDQERSDNSHRHPSFLPDGDHFLYLARRASGTEGNSILVRSLSTGNEKELMRGPAAANYASGHLLFLRESTLMARPFDPGKLDFAGDAFPIAEGIGLLPAGAAYAMFSASDNGVLIYQQGSVDTGLLLEWMDRAGQKTGTLGDEASYQEARLSPDGRSAAVTISSTGSGQWDLWIYNVRRGIRSRFTFDAGSEENPVWSPDSRYIVFASDRTGNNDLYRKQTTGTGTAEPLLEAEGVQRPESFSPDGRYLSYLHIAPPSKSEKSTGDDTWILPLTGDRKPYPLLQSKFNEFASAFSPDGRWIAYASDESGRDEVYVMPFREPDDASSSTGKWQVSTSGGVQPQWRRDGKEIVYLTSAGQVMAAEVSARGDTFEVGNVQPLFEARPPNLLYQRLPATRDHKKFLSVSLAGEQTDAPITLVVNWTAELKK